MIDTIIFDIGRVLVKFEWREYLSSFAFDPDVCEALAEAMFKSDAWNEYDRSELTDEQILALFIRRAPRYSDQIKQVFENFPTCLTAFAYSQDWIKSLKEQGYRIYYLSNYAKTTHLKSKKELAFLDLMDGGLMSYEIHRIKPDPEIYQALFEKYQITPGHAVFIDDNEANIAAAEKLGLHTVLFTDHESVVSELKTILA